MGVREALQRHKEMIHRCTPQMQQQRQQQLQQQQLQQQLLLQLQ